MRVWREEDYDDHGNLCIWKGVWWALFLLAHPWWLVALDISMEKKGGGILSVIYPTTEALYAVLACSTGVFVFLFVCPFRHAVPRLMAVSYALVMMTCVLMVLWACVHLYLSLGSHDEELWLSFFLLMLGCLVALWPDLRNRETYCQWSG